MSKEKITLRVKELICSLFWHDWVDMKNEVIYSGYLCIRCGKLKNMYDKQNLGN